MCLLTLRKKKTQINSKSFAKFLRFQSFESLSHMSCRGINQSNSGYKKIYSFLAHEDLVFVTHNTNLDKFFLKINLNAIEKYSVSGND